MCRSIGQMCNVAVVGISVVSQHWVIREPSPTLGQQPSLVSSCGWTLMLVQRRQSSPIAYSITAQRARCIREFLAPRDLYLMGRELTQLTTHSSCRWCADMAL